MIYRWMEACDTLFTVTVHVKFTVITSRVPKQCYAFVSLFPLQKHLKMQINELQPLCKGTKWSPWRQVPQGWQALTTLA